MRTRWRVRRIAVCGLLCVGLLSGCDALDDAGDLLRITSSAEAQNVNDQRIQTFVIEAGSFELTADILPTVTVFDSAMIIRRSLAIG